MLELYFIFYRVPKMMTRIAREQNRSALAWSLLGIGTWIGAEIFVAFGLTLIYEAGVAAADWTTPEPAGLRFATYLLGLVAAFLSVTGLRRLLESKGPSQYQPPPIFSDKING
jgi:hypothetical protein